MPKKRANGTEQAEHAETKLGIYELKEKLKVSNPIFFGAKHFYRWAEDKKLTEAEFKRAIKDFATKKAAAIARG